MNEDIIHRANELFPLENESSDSNEKNIWAGKHNLLNKKYQEIYIKSSNDQYDIDKDNYEKSLITLKNDLMTKSIDWLKENINNYIEYSEEEGNYKYSNKLFKDYKKYFKSI